MSWSTNPKPKRTARDAGLDCLVGHPDKQQRSMNALDYVRVSDDHRDEMDEAMSSLSDTQLEEILVQAAFRDDVIRDILLGVSEKNIQEERQNSSHDFHTNHEKIKNLIDLAAKFNDDHFPANRCERRCLAQISRVIENDVVAIVRKEDTMQTKILATEYLFDLAGMLASSVEQVQLGLTKAAIPDRITNGIFKVQSLFSDEEMQQILNKGGILQKALETWRSIENYGRNTNWLPLRDACELYNQPSTLLDFNQAREQAQHALINCSPVSYSQFEDRTGPIWNEWKTAGQLKKDVETAVIRGITRKLSTRSAVENRITALQKLVSIGLMVQMARSLPEYQYQIQVLETLELDNLITNALEYVIALPHEGNLGWKFSNLGEEALDLKKDILDLEKAAAGKTFPGLSSIIIKLGIR